MTIDQISVFLENKSGRLADVTKVLADGEINLRAMTIADTADFGILRIIVNEPDKAYELLEKNGFTVRITKVLGIEIEDEPGGLHKVMYIFENNSINIEYLYVILKNEVKKVILIMKVENIEQGLKIMEKNNLVAVSEKKF